MAALEPSAELLPLSVSAFDGRVPGGLLVASSGASIYPVGSSVVLQDPRTRACVFLTGHTSSVTALALSPDGKLLASGQRGAPGSSTPVLLWLLDASGGGSVAARLVQHKGALQATAFSRDGGLLATLGGADDGLLAVWDVQTALALGCSGPVRPLCSAIAGEAAALALCWTRGSVSTGSERGIRQLITSGQRHVRAWFIDKDARRLKAESWVMGAASQRVVTCLALDDDDKRLFAGTTSGDVLEFNVHEGTFVRASPQALAGGVRSLAFFRMGGTCEVRGRDGSKAVSSGDGGGSIGGSDACLLAGSGEGALARLSVGGRIVLKPLSVTALAELEGSVTSISPSCSNDVDILADCGGSGKGGGELTILVGTAAGATYELRLPAMTTRLLSTAHAAPVAAVTFACSPALLLTAGADSVRLWNVRAPPVAAELLRVVVADGGAAALCVAIDSAGSTVLSGWSDGQLRAHGPQSGRLMFAAENAHAGGVTAVAFTHDGARALSGGRDGRVRVWAATARDGAAVGDMLLSLKEHTKEVSALVVSADDAQAISASADGSCLFWSLARGARLRAVFANTSIRALALTPDASLLLTAGIDCRVTYWEVATTKAIRVMDGFTNEITSLDIDATGTVFVTAGLDRLVRLFNFDTGQCIAAGAGHAGAIRSVRIAPDGSKVASVGDDGAVILWSMPAGALQATDCAATAEHGT